MKIAICDDDIICREMVLELVQIYITEQNQNLSVTAYEHGDDLLEDAKKIGGYDIYLLDETNFASTHWLMPLSPWSSSVTSVEPLE